MSNHFESTTVQELKAMARIYRNLGNFSKAEELLALAEAIEEAASSKRPKSSKAEGDSSQERKSS